MRDLLAIQVIVELNVAFCERHLVNCPASEQMEKECTYVSISCVCLQSGAYLLLLQIAVSDSICPYSNRAMLKT